jgi:hypothetical protein
MSIESAKTSWSKDPSEWKIKTSDGGVVIKKKFKDSPFEWEIKGNLNFSSKTKWSKDPFEWTFGKTNIKSSWSKQPYEWKIGSKITLKTKWSKDVFEWVSSDGMVIKSSWSKDPFEWKIDDSKSKSTLEERFACIFIAIMVASNPDGLFS